MKLPTKLHPTRSPGSLPSGSSLFTFYDGIGSSTQVRANSWFEARPEAARILGAPLDRLRLVSVNGKAVSDG